MSNPVMNRALHQLLGAVFPKVNEEVGDGKWEICTVHARIRCEQPVVDILVSSNSDGDPDADADSRERDDENSSSSGTKTNITLIPDYETSAVVMSAVKAMWSQQGAEDTGAPWGAIRFNITKECKMTMQFDAVEDEEEGEDGKTKDDVFMDQVYDARKKLYETKFGKSLPDLIIKMKHLFGVWPLGGLVTFQTSVLDEGENHHVLTTFGLSNPDMPAKLKSVPMPGNAEGNFIVHKEVQPLPRVGMAGHGYEMLIVTKDAQDWPKATLQWVCSNELLGDINFLGRVEALGNITAGNVPAGDGKMVNVLIAPPHVMSGRASLPISGDLPNGKMKFLILTVITEDELNFSLEHGRLALLNLLYEKGDGQISDLDRESVEI